MKTKTDLEKPISIKEAAESLASALQFAGNNTDPAAIIDAQVCDDNSVVATLAHWHNFSQGRPQNFRIIIERIS